MLGVDVARFGDDRTVIFFRRGRDARTLAPVQLRSADLMTLAARVAETRARMRADAIFVDEGGMGAGVVDRLRQLGCPACLGINFGGAPDGVAIGGESVALRQQAGRDVGHRCATG